MSKKYKNSIEEVRAIKVMLAKKSGYNVAKLLQMAEAMVEGANTRSGRTIRTVLRKRFA